MSPSLLTLKKALKRDSTMLPSFINNERIVDRELYDAARFIFVDLDKLMSDEVHKASKIKQLSGKIDNILGDMALIDSTIALNYYMHFEDLLFSYFNFCFDNEIWESCHNIREFYESLYNKKFEKKDYE